MTLWPMVLVPEGVRAKPLEHLLEYGSQTASTWTIHLHPVGHSTDSTWMNVRTPVFEGRESESDVFFVI